MDEHHRYPGTVPPGLPIHLMTVTHVEHPGLVRLDVATAHRENGSSDGPRRTTAFHTVS